MQTAVRRLPICIQRARSSRAESGPLRCWVTIEPTRTLAMPGLLELELEPESVDKPLVDCVGLPDFRGVQSGCSGRRSMRMDAKARG
jgi:hypothetical protein